MVNLICDINILYTKFSRNITDKINYVKSFYLTSQVEKFLQLKRQDYT